MVSTELSLQVDILVKVPVNMSADISSTGIYALSSFSSVPSATSSTSLLLFNVSSFPSYLVVSFAPLLVACHPGVDKDKRAPFHPYGN
ncbi:hypothetical protein L1987_19997 [Smallanthus sonchifolius]|uniref:Uncharacterized protein n=1 Tax=Smallanthus sonchifolius TaxID=185202 RepID=A0ACB9ISB2_9ASTR|nr:hypothetical protein L1987_19997 [Smallanthus sonchifolius]